MRVLVKTSSIRLTKAGKKYLDMTIATTGGEEFAAKIWDYEFDNTLPQGALIEITGEEDEWNGRKQFNVQSFDPVEATMDELSKFMTSTSHDRVKLWEKIKFIVDGEMNEPEKSIVGTMFKVHGEKFAMAPAASLMHHDWLGGLLEHTSEMCDIWLKIKDNFAPINSSKVFFGIMMHDFCKIFEYEWDKGMITTSHSGQLLPHIPKSVQVLTRIMDQLEVQPEMQDELLHIVVAHHGKLSWGSPVAPATIEALAVHWIDNLHGTLWAGIKHIEKFANNNPGQPWTGKHFLIENSPFMVPQVKDTIPVADETSDGDEEEIPI